jgi:hypothetical protein
MYSKGRRLVSVSPGEHMRFSRLIPVLALAVIAGCDSNPTEPEINVDAALAQMASSGISTYSTAALGAGGVAVAVPTPNSSASSCTYNATTAFFVCAPVTANGITFARQYQLLDATGAAVSTPNPFAVASIRSVIDMDGTITQQGAQAMTIQIDRHEDAVLSGIQSANRVLNGSSTQLLTATGSGFSFASNDVSTTTNLQLPSTAAQKYPLGGTIVTDRTFTSSGAASVSQQQHQVIAFDGTNLMTVTLTIGASTTPAMTCKIDLSGAAAPVCT